MPRAYEQATYEAPQVQAEGRPEHAPSEQEHHERLREKAKGEYEALLMALHDGLLDPEDPILKEKLRDLEQVREGWGIVIRHPPRRGSA